MSRTTAKYSLSLDVDLIEKIDRIAKAQRRSRSNLVNLLLLDKKEDIVRMAKKLGASVSLILFACSCAPYPIILPESGMVTKCNGNVGTVQFTTTGKSGFAEAEFFIDDCRVGSRKKLDDLID